MSALDGGSAAPPTADVPTLARRLNRPMLERLRRCAADTDPNWAGAVTIYPPEARDLIALIDALDHSGVAGEPEATTEEASESAQDSGPTPTHAPTPETPGAANVAGGVTVPDEAVEKFWTTFADAGGQFHANGRAVTPAIRAGLAAAAPLIAARVARELLDAVSADADPLVDRLAALLCDDCDPGPCHDSISEAGRVLKFLANAGRLLPEGGQTEHGWGMRDRTGKVYPARSEQDARELASNYAARGVEVVKQPICTGPWVAVDPEEKTDA